MPKIRYILSINLSIRWAYIKDIKKHPQKDKRKCSRWWRTVQKIHFSSEYQLNCLFLSAQQSSCSVWPFNFPMVLMKWSSIYSTKNMDKWSTPLDMALSVWNDRDAACFKVLMLGQLFQGFSLLIYAWLWYSRPLIKFDRVGYGYFCLLFLLVYHIQ